MAVQSPIPLPAGSPQQIHQYQLVRSIGAGGMGVVYEAFHLRLKRRVALKVLAPQFATSPDAVDRFEREMAAIGQLLHPNIVQAIDAGVHQTIHYLVMEYVDGANIDSICRRVGLLQLRDACEIVRQAAKGLAHAHSFGIVHRDIKPSNLLLSVSGQVKIADLGLARFHHSSDQAPLTAVGDILGTFDYMSPEQAAGTDVGPASDVYSLGATLFRLLAGVPLFAGPRFCSPADKIQAHISASPTRLSSLRNDIPSQLDELLLRLLAKEPSDRPQSLHKVIDALAPYCEDAALSELLPPATPPPAFNITTEAMHWGETKKTPLPERRRWITKRILAATLGAVALTALSVWGSSALHHGSEKPVQHFAETPVPVTSTPATRLANIPREKLELQSWHTFSSRAPYEIIWPDDGLSSFTFDSSRSRLTASCADFGVLSFGRIDVPNYRLRVELFQNGWHGDVGVFLGMRQHPVIPRAFLAQGFGFFSSDSPDQGLRLFLRRTQVVIKFISDDDFRIEFVKKHDTQVDRPAGYSETLDFEIAPSGLSHIRWRGADVPELCAPEINRDFEALDYRGPFGIYLSESDLTVSRVELMPMSQ